MIPVLVSLVLPGQRRPPSLTRHSALSLDASGCVATAATLLQPERSARVQTEAASDSECTLGPHVSQLCYSGRFTARGSHLLVPSLETGATHLLCKVQWITVTRVDHLLAGALLDGADCGPRHRSQLHATVGLDMAASGCTGSRVPCRLGMILPPPVLQGCFSGPHVQGRCTKLPLSTQATATGCTWDYPHNH